MPEHTVGMAALVVNPAKVDELEALRTLVTTSLHEAGWPDPLWFETTEDDPGYGMTEKAIDAGATVVLACGGDGTVRAALTVLAGTDTSLAVLPMGTGNLLARNLGIPIDDRAAAVAIALGDQERVLDVGRVENDDSTARTERFAIMAGIGMDAAIMRDAPATVKAKIGWPAYLISGVRQLRRPGVRARISVDGHPARRARAQTIVIGNMGSLQGGIDLLPDAEPDDGRLDVAVLVSRGLLDWARIIFRVLTRRTDVDDRFTADQGERIEVRLLTPQPRQLDGDPIPPRDRLVVQIEPGAIRVRVPPSARTPRPT